MRRNSTMQEKQLINKLKELQQIKPRKDWVILVKNQIISQPEKKQTHRFSDFLSVFPALVYQRKLAYAFATFLFVMVGMFGLSQYQVTEQPQTAFVSQENQLQNNFETANKKLDDLTQIVKDNKTENIAPAIKDFQASISEATRSLISNISQKNSKSIKDIAIQVKKIEDNKKQLQTLGVDLGATKESKDLNDALAPLVQQEINDLEKTTLTEDQQKIMQEVKDLYADGKYSDALEGILMLNN